MVSEPIEAIAGVGWISECNLFGAFFADAIAYGDSIAWRPSDFDHEGELANDFLVIVGHYLVDSTSSIYRATSALAS